LTDLEFHLLDELYFTIAFDELMSRFEIKERQTARLELERMIRQNYVSQMIYHSQRNDYEKLDSLDSRLLDTSYFVITKRGLMLHNSR
jgi:hypothetical protein